MEKTTVQAVSIPYGREHLEVRGPFERCALLETASLPPCPNLARELERALTHPLGSPPLSLLLANRRRVTLVVPDKTRPTALRELLPLLFEQLQAHRIPPEGITLLIALGIHTPMTWQELEEHLGEDTCRRFPVRQNLAKNVSEMVPLGATSRGTPVALHRATVDTDLVLAVGAVSHHYTAGFGGGRKLLVPGCASYQTCVGNHSLVLGESAPHPQCRAGRMADNPVHLDMLEAAQRLPTPTFFLQSVLTAEGKIHRLFGGEMETAHRAAVEEYRRLFGHPVERRYETLILGCGGHPRDINFIQAHKALQNAVPLLAEGGSLIALAACSDGYGHLDFPAWLAIPTEEEMFAKLKKSYVIYGQTALATRRKSKRYRIHLFSSLSAAETAAMGMEKVASLAALPSLLPAAPPHRPPRCAIIPDGAHYWAIAPEEKP